jgi:hypothetical protein
MKNCVNSKLLMDTASKRIFILFLGGQMFVVLAELSYKLVRLISQAETRLITPFKERAQQNLSQEVTQSLHSALMDRSSALIRIEIIGRRKLAPVSIS